MNYFYDIILGGIYLFQQPKQPSKYSMRHPVINQMWCGVDFFFLIYKYVVSNLIPHEQGGERLNMQLL